MSTEGVGKPYACACCGVALSEARRRGRDHSLLFRWLTHIGCKEIAPPELRGDMVSQTNHTCLESQKNNSVNR